MKRTLLAILLALGVSQVQALQLPKSCGSDARVRCVDYNPDEVVEITAMFGLQTFILFSPDEEIQDIGGGDSEGWDIGPITKKNGLFIKPKSYKPATNITVVTSKRYYNFDFKVSELKNAEDRNFMTKFRYPEDAKKVDHKAQEAERVETLLSTSVSSKRKNEDYWYQGSEDLSPTAAWDDGETTYFRFAPNTPLPAIYVVNPDGSETMVNKDFPEVYTAAVRLVAKKFVFRRDGTFTCIYNESYDKYGVENQSRTVSPLVKRVVREDKRLDMDRAAAPRTVTIMPGQMPPQIGNQGGNAGVSPMGVGGGMPGLNIPMPTINLSHGGR